MAADPAGSVPGQSNPFRYLDAQDPSGWPSPNVNTTVSRPSAPGALAETGNSSMVAG
jgi:hypothetical protein